MSKQERTVQLPCCRLLLNVHCVGCQRRIKKELKKIDGVCNVDSSIEQGRVLVVGNVNPAILVKRLKKIGKHAKLEVEGFTTQAALGGQAAQGQGQAAQGGGGGQGNGQAAQGGGGGQGQGQAAQGGGGQMGPMGHQGGYYNAPPPPMPHPQSECYAHMFSDENTTSGCSIM